MIVFIITIIIFIDIFLEMHRSTSSRQLPVHLNFWKLVCSNFRPTGQKLCTTNTPPNFFVNGQISERNFLLIDQALKLVDFFFWAIFLRKWTIYLKRLHIYRYKTYIPMERLPTPAEQGLNPLRDDGRGKRGGMLKFRIYQHIMNILLSMQISFILYLLKIFVCLIHPISSLMFVCHSIHPRSRYVCQDFFSTPKWSEGLQFSLVLLTLR